MHHHEPGAGEYRRQRPRIMQRCVVAVWCLVSVWGCAHSVVQPAPHERSAIAFAQRVVQEMSSGLDKLRAAVVATVTEKGDYRIFAGEFFPRGATRTDMMQNFARFCTHIGGIMSQSVCHASAPDDKQVKFVVHAEERSPSGLGHIQVNVTVYEPVGMPSAEFLQVIRPYR